MRISITIYPSLSMAGTENSVPIALDALTRKIRARSATPHVGDRLDMTDENGCNVGTYSVDAGHAPSKEDWMLSARELCDKYGARGEHPEASREEWKDEVASGESQLGYWDWVVVEIDPGD